MCGRKGKGMFDNEYVYLHKKMLRNPVVFKDAEHVAVWTWLLLNAKHENFDAMFAGERIIVHAGQIITSRAKMAANLCISASKIERVLGELQNEQQIEQLMWTKNRLITVKNWDKYQFSEQLNGQLNEQQANSKVNSNCGQKTIVNSGENTDCGQVVNSKLNNQKRERKEAKEREKKLVNNKEIKIQRDMRAILRERLRDAYTSSDIGRLIDEVIDVLINACESNRVKTFNKKKLTSKMFRDIADKLNYVMLGRICNSLMTYKADIENREHYILGVIVAVCC